ncbi:MAG: LacI family DNA-binding transcriptional regulator [Oscillospiraceae bacterium]|jgi:DNA-binding LacI/PurR family transcriptional regulator
MSNFRRPTMKDIAKHMNISVTTVSKVINGHADISEKTRQEVLRTIEEMGYVQNFMASNLRRIKSNMVALVLSDISTPYFSPVIRGYEKTLSQAGYQILIFGSYENPQKEYDFIRKLSSLQVAGIILDLAKGSEKSIPELQASGIPFVLSNRYIQPDEGPIVSADNELAGYLATRHLLKRKPNRPVVCINGPDHISPTCARYAGYVRALQEAEQELKPEYVYHNYYGLEDSFQVCKEIAASLEPPFSIFCHTDLIAIGVLSGLRAAGLRVPEDVGVIGVDDIEMAAYLTPPLSTVAIPKEQIGELSAKILIDLMEGRTVENPIRFLPPELIQRETT